MDRLEYWGTAGRGIYQPSINLFMALLHWIGRSSSTVALSVQMLGIVALAITLMANVRVLQSLNEDNQNSFAELAYLSMAGTYAPALSWILEGSEAGMVAAGVAVSTVLAFGAYDRHQFTL